MAMVGTGWTPIQYAPVPEVPRHNRNRIGADIGIAAAAWIIVDTLRKGVGDIQIDAVREALLYRDLQRVVGVVTGLAVHVDRSVTLEDSPLIGSQSAPRNVLRRVQLHGGLSVARVGADVGSLNE